MTPRVLRRGGATRARARPGVVRNARVARIVCSRRARVGVRKAKSELKISAPISRAKYLENVQPTAFVWSDLLQLFCHCYPRRTSSSSLRARAPGRIRVVMSASDGTNGTKSLYGDKEKASEVRSCVRKSSAVDSERTREWGAVFRSSSFPDTSHPRGHTRRLTPPFHVQFTIIPVLGPKVRARRAEELGRLLQEQRRQVLQGPALLQAGVGPSLPRRRRG